MFPFENENEILDLDNKEEPATDDFTRREYGIDFKTGKLTGKIVDGAEAVKVWAWLALKAVRYRFEIYTWNYGNELESLIGAAYSQEYIESEVTRMIEDAFSINIDILSIEGLVCDFKEDKLIIQATILTIFGREEFNV